MDAGNFYYGSWWFVWPMIPARNFTWEQSLRLDALQTEAKTEMSIATCSVKPDSSKLEVGISWTCLNLHIHFMHANRSGGELNCILNSYRKINSEKWESNMWALMFTLFKYHFCVSQRWTNPLSPVLGWWRLNNSHLSKCHLHLSCVGAVYGCSAGQSLWKAGISSWKPKHYLPVSS